MRIFHLSITADGQVSLWDKQRTALDGKQNGEMYFALQLTPQQEATLNDMASRATVNRDGSQVKR